MLYNVSELLEKLTEIKNDGFEIVDICFIEADDELPACINFEVPNGIENIDYEEVDSIGSNYE